MTGQGNSERLTIEDLVRDVNDVFESNLDFLGDRKFDRASGALTDLKSALEQIGRRSGRK